MNSTEDRIKKLPAWARLVISGLESQVTDLQRAFDLQKMESSKESSGQVTIHLGYTPEGLRREVLVPDHATINFNFDAGHKITMNRHLHDPLIEVYAHPGLIHIMPRSANALHLVPECVFERKRMGD